MTTNLAVRLFLIVAGCGLLAAITSSFALGTPPLRHRHLSSFARRQHWVPTDDGIGLVATALALVRRWRRVGLMAGLIAGIVLSVREGRLTIDFLAMFLGWFAGAIVAEWRISRLVRPTGPRMSDLQRRGVATYLTPLVRGWVLVVALALAGSAAVALVMAIRQGELSSWLRWAVVLSLGAGVLWLTMRRIMDRPHGFVDAGLRDADDAVRCQSMTVLAGCTIAAAGALIGEFVTLCLTPTFVASEPDLAALLSIGPLLVGIVLGWWVATSSRSPRHVARVRDASVVEAA